jgi:hypothetical protein
VLTCRCWSQAWIWEGIFRLPRGPLFAERTRRGKLTPPERSAVAFVRDNSSPSMGCMCSSADDVQRRRIQSSAAAAGPAARVRARHTHRATRTRPRARRESIGILWNTANTGCTYFDSILFEFINSEQHTDSVCGDPHPPPKTANDDSTSRHGPRVSESDLEASLCGDFEYIIYLCDDMIFTRFLLSPQLSVGRR